MIVSVQPLDEVTIIVTLNVPEVAYVCEGFAEVDEVRSPKLHDSLVIPPEEIVDVFVKFTGEPIQTVLAVNDAFGKGYTVSGWVILLIHPPAVVTCRVTLKFPLPA